MEGEGKETRQVRVKVAFYTKRKMTGNDDTTDDTPAKLTRSWRSTDQIACMARKCMVAHAAA